MAAASLFTLIYLVSGSVTTTQRALRHRNWFTHLTTLERTPTQRSSPRWSHSLLTVLPVVPHSTKVENVVCGIVAKLSTFAQPPLLAKPSTDVSLSTAHYLNSLLIAELSSAY